MSCRAHRRICDAPLARIGMSYGEGDGRCMMPSSPDCEAVRSADDMRRVPDAIRFRTPIMQQSAAAVTTSKIKDGHVISWWLWTMRRLTKTHSQPS